MGKRSLSQRTAKQEANAKLDVLTSYVSTKSATMAQTGAYTSARVENRAWKQMMRRCAEQQTPQAVDQVESWSCSMATLDDELARTEMSELQPSVHFAWVVRPAPC